MRYSKDMIEGKEYCSRTWNDDAANFYTKTGDIITIETVYRFAKRPEPKVMTIKEYDAWQDKVKSTVN